MMGADELFSEALQLHQAGDLGRAEGVYAQILQMDGRHWAATRNLGLVARQRGQWERALQFHRRELELGPGNPRSHSDLGELHRDMQQYEEALACYERAMELDPSCLEAMNGKGIVLFAQGRGQQAIECWQGLIRVATGGGAGVNPQHPMGPIVASAYNNLGSALLEKGSPDEAAKCYLLACQWKPFNPGAHGNWLMDYAYVEKADAGEMLSAARQWWVRYTGNIAARRHGKGDAEKTLKVGFVSGDFRNHSVAFFLMGLFEHFDRERFAFTCYAAVPMPDAYTDFFRKHASAWRDIQGLTDVQLAERIAADGIDVLVDLAGFTSSTRLRAFAHRAAPVQIAYLGYPATTGCPAIDYRITDGWADPVGMTEGHFSERLLRLNRCAWSYTPQLGAGAEAAGRGERRGGGFTFGSFNNFAKVTPATIRLWSGILRAAAGSRLFIKAQALSDEPFRRVVEKRFAAEGVGAERLILKGRIAEMTDHLAAYQDVDLALDTFPYHGTTTTCEALSMNVPVLTLAGRTHHSRVGVSLLTAVGLEDLVTESADRYAAMAIRLAGEAGLLDRYRRGLRERLMGSSLADGKGFAAAFCEAVRGVWRERCR